MSVHLAKKNSEIVGFASNVLSTFAALVKPIHGVTESMEEALDTAIGNMTVALNLQANAKTAVLAATETVNQRRAEINTLLSEWNNKMKANTAPPQIIADTGFSPNSQPVAAIQAIAPIDLVVQGFSNGENVLKFSKNGAGSNGHFVIERKVGNGQWQIVATTKKTKYTDSGQTPGVPTLYRVCRAEAQSMSGTCEPAGVYLG